MKKIWDFCKKHKNIIFLGLIIVLALRVFVPQLDSLVQSIQELKNADPTWVIAALCVFALGTPIVTWQYMTLAIIPLRFVLTLRVQIAALFVSKLLPIGLGNIAINMYYFVQEKHSLAQATAVMAANTVTSGVAYAFLILFGFMFSDFTIEEGGLDTSDISLGKVILVIIGLLMLCYLVYRLPKIKTKVDKAIKDVIESLRPYKKEPWSIVMATVLNGVGSFTSLFALFASAHALGVDISISQALVAYTFGNVASALVPTPGGIGSAEAGIYAGLVLIGVDSGSAVNVTLLYRLISYWIPILPGYIFLRGLKKDVLKNFDVKSSAAVAQKQTA